MIKLIHQRESGIRAEHYRVYRDGKDVGYIAKNRGNKHWYFINSSGLGVSTIASETFRGIKKKVLEWDDSFKMTKEEALEVFLKAISGGLYVSGIEIGENKVYFNVGDSHCSRGHSMLISDLLKRVEEMSKVLEILTSSEIGGSHDKNKSKV